MASELYLAVRALASSQFADRDLITVWQSVADQGRCAGRRRL